MTENAKSAGNPVIVLQIPGPRAVQTSVDEFHKKINPFVDTEKPRILLDLSKVEFVDSSFLGALVMQLKRVMAKNGEMRLFGLQPPVKKLFEMLRLYRIFEIFDTEEQARKSLP